MSVQAVPRLFAHQMSRQEALDYAASRRWEVLTPKELAVLQLRQDRLCVDFSAFHAGMTELLGRPVYTHEFADPDSLWREYLDGEPIDLAAVLLKLPEHIEPIALALSGDRP